MRIFVSINLLPEIKKYLEEVGSGFVVARATPAKSSHLTLKFLGEVSDEKMPEIKEKLGRINFKKFRIELTEAGFFTDRNGHIRVIWVGLTSPPELMQLQKEIEDAVSKYGAVKTENFIPHLTLSRVKYANDKDLSRQIKNAKIKKLEMEVEHFSLMQSQLSPTGPIYTELEKFGDGGSF
ncbi:RNA 2',3'-cyclic phosphodiesterase [Candidatus Peregrinibacteria bacterium]|nr:RNA 2',3'-cyclic phosphodiesterase [Candidatus Peregrinibacteria bacterium]